MPVARWLSSFVFVAAAVALPATETKTLTLEEALGSVERVNLSVLLSRETAAQSLEVVNQQRSNVLPLIDGTASQRRSRSVSVASSGATNATTSSRFDATLTGSYALLDVERLSALRSARAGAQVAQANYHTIVQDVLADVSQAYFLHLRNQRRLAVLDANISRAKSLYELANNQLRAGVATQIDVTRAEAQVAQAEQARLQQVTTLQQSELFLKRLIDIAPAAPLSLTDFQVRRADVGTSLFTSAEEQGIFAKRSDYLAQQKAIEQAKIDVQTAKLQRLPALSLSGQYGVAAAHIDDDKKDAWSAGLGVSVPIFDGLRAGADRRIALSRQRAQEMRLHNLELQISSELRLAQQDANSRNAQVTVAEKNLRLAREELTLAQSRYQNGVADNREVVEAQTRLAVADDNLVEAVYQYNLSRVEYARARGDVRSVLSEKVQ